MAIDKVKEYFRQFGMEDRVMEFPVSSATVELAAKAAGVIPARIAKTMSFQHGESGILIVTAGDAKIDNSKFKGYFKMKAKMLSPDDVLKFVGHAVGGVCPFAVADETVKVYTDVSMKRFESVFPACGSDNSAIGLSCDELFKYAGSLDWIDVCKGWQEEEIAE